MAGSGLNMLQHTGKRRPLWNFSWDRVHERVQELAVSQIQRRIRAQSRIQGRIQRPTQIQDQTRTRIQSWIQSQSQIPDQTKARSQEQTQDQTQRQTQSWIPNLSPDRAPFLPIRPQITSAFLLISALTFPLITQAQTPLAESQAQREGRGSGESARASQLKAELAQKAQGLVNQLLALHCPDRCSLLGIEVEVEEGQSLIRVQPGFEELGGGPKTVKASRIEVGLLLDARLPQAFRRDVLALTQARLKSLSVPVVVRSDVVPFPEPLPLELVDLQEPEPQLETAPARPDEAPASVPPELSEELYRNLVKGAPWLLALLIAGIFALLLSRSLGRRAGFAPGDRSGLRSGLRGESAGLTPSEGAAPSSEEDRNKSEISIDALVHRLGAALRQSPQARQAVLRELLTSGKVEDFAHLVRLLGPKIADGLRDDPELRSALRRAAQLLKTGSLKTPSDAQLRQLLSDLESRLGGARLELGDEGGDTLFSFTQRLSPPQLARLFKSAPKPSQLALLRHLSPQQRELLLRELDEPSRQALVLALARSESELSEDPESLLLIAEELRLQAERLLQTGGQELELLVEMLEGLSESEQLNLLAGLSSRPLVLEALLGRLCNESTLSAVDDEVLAAIAAKANIGSLVDFLREAPLPLQERLVALSPRNHASALRDELRLRVRTNPGALRAARREVLGLAREEIESRGLSLLELNDGLAAVLGRSRVGGAGGELSG